jgi:hypothetical protein
LSKDSKFEWDNVNENIHALNKFFKGEKIVEVPKYFKSLYQEIKDKGIDKTFLRIAITVDKNRTFNVYGIYDHEYELNEIEKIWKLMIV